MLVAIDVETATPRAGAICALGVAVLEPNGSVKTKTWLIRPPGNRYDPWNSRVHGLGADDTRNAPSFSEAWSSVRRSMPSVAHVLAHGAAGVERRHLAAALAAGGHLLPPWLLACTLAASRKLRPRWRSHGLATLAERFDIELNHHDAGSDARASLLIAQRLGITRRLSDFAVPWA
jgi:DNA polymerase-3 subunit epsilon